MPVILWELPWRMRPGMLGLVGALCSSPWLFVWRWSVASFWWSGHVFIVSEAGAPSLARVSALSFPVSCSVLRPTAH